MPKEPLKDIIQDVHKELAPILNSLTTGRRAIALGGSLAKKSDDDLSDIDYYLFSDGLAPEEDRRKAVEDKLGKDCGLFLNSNFTEDVWGAVTEFNYRGYRVETSIRPIESMTKMINDCLEGKFEAWLTSWNPNGFYSYVALSDIHTAQIISDEAGIMKTWKTSLAHYPPKLRISIIGQHLAQARFWPGNFHFQSAIQRKDIQYVTGIVQGTISHLIHILFALNETYYPGDKRNLSALAKLPKTPADFGQTVNYLLKDVSTSQNLDERLMKLVNRVSELIAKE
jgi:hypothetical protein